VDLDANAFVSYFGHRLTPRVVYRLSKSIRMANCEELWHERFPRFDSFATPFRNRRPQKSFGGGHPGRIGGDVNDDDGLFAVEKEMGFHRRPLIIR
jgi:hypothetical protein